jgi:hypothetical protein
MPFVKTLCVSKADALGESLNAKAMLIFAVEKDGSVEAVTSADTPFHDKLMTNGSKTFLKSAIGPVPFHTVLVMAQKGCLYLSSPKNPRLCRSPFSPAASNWLG